MQIDRVTLALPARAGRLLQAARCPAAVLAARWSEASITMLTPAGGAVLLTHLVPGAPHPVVRLRVGGMTMCHECIGRTHPAVAWDAVAGSRRQECHD